MKQEVLKYLNKNYDLNVGLIQSVLLDDIKPYYVDSDGVVFFDKNNCLLMTSTEKDEILKSVIDKIPTIDCACTASYHDAKILQKRFGFDILKPCYQTYYEKKEKIPFSSEFEIRKLQPEKEDIDFVYENYTLHFSRDAIKETILSYGMFEVVIDGKRAGFIGMHEEHSMGLLEILPEFRRRGLGTLLTKFMINHCMDIGVVPFAHTIVGNEKSLDMQLKIGMKQTNRYIYWTHC